MNTYFLITLQGNVIPAGTTVVKTPQAAVEILKASGVTTFCPIWYKHYAVINDVYTESCFWQLVHKNKLKMPVLAIDYEVTWVGNAHLQDWLAEDFEIWLAEGLLPRWTDRTKPITFLVAFVLTDYDEDVDGYFEVVKTIDQTALAKLAITEKVDLAN